MSIFAISSATTALAVPALLLAAGLAPRTWAARRPRAMRALATAAAWLAFFGAALTALLFAAGNGGTTVFASIALPGDWGRASLSVLVDALTVTMLLLVSFVGALVTRYACNYLDGDAGQGRFMQWLCLTLAAVLALIVAGNLLLMAAAWIATSLCLHQLLVFYPQRAGAVLAAHKKFILSRLGDLCLLGAIALLGSALHSFELAELFAALANVDTGGALPRQVQWAGWLIVGSAIIKSAQLPFHGWLPQVMEAPTPVSALLHAGIINAGGFLVARMSPLLVQSGAALEFLAVIGAVTAVLAAAIMLTQTSIKASLAWSTCAQMGFMLMQCGLGAFSTAVLHIVAHSLYKAHAFLSSGSVVEAARMAAPKSAVAAAAPVRPWQLAAVLAGTALLTAGVAAVFDVTPRHEPAILVLGAVLAMAVTWLILQSSNGPTGAGLAWRAMAIGGLACTAYFALQTAFGMLLGGAVAPSPPVDGVLIALVAALFFALLLVQALLPQAMAKPHNPRWQAAYVHLSNGLYIDLFLTRITQRIWPANAASSSPTTLTTGVQA